MRSHNSENLSTDQNTQLLTSSFSIIRNIFESWSSTVGLYCLVNDPLLHPKFSGISVIRKSSCGSGVSKVYFSKLVVIERRQFCLPIRDIWRYRERFWGVTVWGTMLLEWINTRNLLNNQCTRPSFSTRNNAAPNVNRTEIKKLCSRPIFALKKFSCILRVYKSHFEDFAGAILLFLFSTVHWHLFGSQGQTLELSNTISSDGKGRVLQNGKSFTPSMHTYPYTRKYTKYHTYLEESCFAWMGDIKVAVLHCPNIIAMSHFDRSFPKPVLFLPVLSSSWDNLSCSHITMQFLKSHCLGGV